MNIEIKGHSGCQIDVVHEDGGLFVYKSSADPKYLSRLALQAEKQKAAGQVKYQHIRVPEVFDIKKADDATVVKMQYVYSKNFIEFFENAGFEQVEYLIGALEQFLEYEISQSPVKTVSAQLFRDKFDSVCRNCKKNALYDGDLEVDSILDRSREVFAKLEDMELPVGLCHGDLTFSNILFNGNNYYLIDFLDSFVETPLQDIVKIRQDTAFRWSQLMCTKRYDEVRLHIVCDKIDREIDRYFEEKYDWYRKYYSVMQLMNILRILPYAHEQKVADYLKRVLTQILDGDKDTLFETEDRIQSSSTGLSLIVPAAADKPEYETGLPYIFGLDQDGVMICLKSILGLDIKKFDAVYFTILKKHNDRFFIEDTLKRQFERFGIPNAKVVLLEKPTLDQVETIYETIKRESVCGSIFIKDADSYYKTELTDGCGVAIFPIESLDILAPKDKSYVAVDDMYYITNIIEKSVVGHFISAGGYLLDASMFVWYYNRMREFGKLYLSHIIYAMLLDKVTFRPMMVDEYKDWGTKRDLNRNE